MADIGASNWNEADASNTTAAPDGWPEGMAPSGVNDSGRAMQGAIKRWYDWTIPKTTGGTSTAYTLSYTVAPGALVDGMTHLVQFNAVNGATPTLNVNTLGAKPLHFYCGGSWAALPANALAVDQIVEVTYNSGAGTYRCVGMPLVLTQTASAASTVDFTGIPTNVNHLTILFRYVPGTNAVDCGLQFYGTGGSLDTGSNYTYAQQAVNSASGTGVAGGNPINSILLNRNGNTVSTTGISGRIDILDIQRAAATMCVYQTYYLDSGAAVFLSNVGGASHSVAANITGFRIAVSAGTMSGRATVLGYS